MALTVIALDPGVTTGYAIGKIDDGEMLVVTGQERWLHFEFWGFLEDSEPDIIICERFEFRNKARTGLELFSRELIGIVHLFHAMHMDPNNEVVMQMAGPVIGGYFKKPENMPGIYKLGKIHSNEAAMHLLYWFKFGAGFKYNTKGFRSALQEETS